MEEEKKLYPFKFVHIDETPGETVHIADLGYQDSQVRNGWLAANSISEIMDMYVDRVVGEHVFEYYGRQFPVMVKAITGETRTPLTVHPDDETAQQRFDFLGKAKLWYVKESRADAVVYLGFKRDVEAEEFYMACRHGDVESLLNPVAPKAGDCFFIYPGLVHAACEGVSIIEIAESSPLDFKLFNWGREIDGDEFDASLNLEEAFDFIDYKKYCRCGHHHCDGEGHECHCHDDHEEGHGCHCHEHDAGEKPARRLTDCDEFSVSEIRLGDPMHIYSEQLDSFTVYTCVSGSASLQVRDSEGQASYDIPEGETVLVPAEIPDFFLVPTGKETVLLETVVEKRPETDPYIDPSAEAGCGCGEDDCDCDDCDDDCDDGCGCGHCHDHEHFS